MSDEVAPTEPPPKPLLADLKEFLQRHEQVGAFLKMAGTFLLGAGAMLAAAWAMMGRLVDEKVEKRMAPYERLLEAMSLNQAEDFNAAVDVLRAMPAEDATRLNDRRMGDLCADVQLYALANCDTPVEHTAEFEKLVSRMDKEMSESAWRWQQRGWYLMRIGKPVEAEGSFRRAAGLHDLQSDLKGAEDAERGLLLTALARGDAAGAEARLRTLCERRPWLTEAEARTALRAWPQERWFEQLRLLHGKGFDEAFAKVSAPSPAGVSGGR